MLTFYVQINHYAGVCSKRLERTAVNAKRQRLKKPTLEEIDLARLHIFRASMFGGTLEEVMALQRDRFFSSAILMFILLFCSLEEIHNYNATKVQMQDYIFYS